MTRVLIIGYGNPLRGDDGFGPALAQRLQNDLANDAGIEIIACHQLTLELAEPLSRARCAIFIDAAGGDTPGEIVCHPLQTAADAPAQFTHHLVPQALLTYARSLYGAHPPEAFLLSVSGRDFGYRETLSEPVATALERAHTQLCKQVRTESSFSGYP